MKKLLLLAFFVLPALAQISTPGVQYVTNAPSGSCSATPPIQVVRTTGVAYTCNNGTWGTAPSGPPSGSAGGFLTGTYPNPGGPTASGYGLVPVSTGAGTSYALQVVPLSFGANNSQFIEQPLGTGFYTSFNVNFINKVFNVDGFGYAGINQSPIPYNSATDAALCQVVSSSGSYYVAISEPNHTTTPGADYRIWYPVPNNAAATPSDCAWRFARSYTRQFHQNSLVKWGSAVYLTNQTFINDVDGNSFDDEFAVSGLGCGQGCTYLQYSGSTALPVISRPTGGGNSASWDMEEMTIDGGGVASAILETSTTSNTPWRALSMGNIVPGSNHVAELGTGGGGDGFQNFLDSWNIGIFPDGGTGNCGVFTANLSGGGISSITVNTAGACYDSTANGGRNITVVKFLGTQNGVANQPCATMPTGWGVTYTGTGSGVGIATVTGGTSGSGCVAPIYVQVYQTPNVQFGLIMNSSDSTAKDIVSYIGADHAFKTIANVYIHLHPSVVPNGIEGEGNFLDTECDATFANCFDILSPFTNNGSKISGTWGFIGGGRLFPGSAVFNFQNTIQVTTPIAISDSIALCVSNPGGGAPTGWNEFVTPSGPIVNPVDYINKSSFGSGLTVTGNDTSCGQTMGNYSPTETAQDFTVANLHGYFGQIQIIDSPNLASGQYFQFGGNSNIQVSSDPNFSRMIFNDTTSSVWTMNLLSAAIGGYNTSPGPAIPNNACFQWSSASNGQSASDTYLCRSAAGALQLNGNPLPITGTPTAGQAACIKSAGPPVVIGYCSSVVGVGGACTCN